MSRRRYQRALLGAALATAFVVSASAFAAAKPVTEKQLGSFGVWRTYTYSEGGQTVCYMVTTKTIKSIGPKKRAAPYLMVTHRPIEASTDVLSYGAGTLLDSRRGIKLHIGKTIFDLFSVRDTAWARDALTDHKIATALRNTPSAQVSASSAKKGASPIRDTFDLTEAAAAYHSIGKACGLSVDAPRKPAAKAVHSKKPHKS